MAFTTKLPLGWTRTQLLRASALNRDFTNTCSLAGIDTSEVFGPAEHGQVFFCLPSPPAANYDSSLSAQFTRQQFF
jgi:hypothetical protein